MEKLKTWENHEAWKHINSTILAETFLSLGVSIFSIYIHLKVQQFTLIQEVTKSNVPPHAAVFLMDVGVTFFCFCLGMFSVTHLFKVIGNGLGFWVCQILYLELLEQLQ
jgi:hypothetical protein